MRKYEYVSKGKALAVALTTLSAGLAVFALSLLNVVSRVLGALALATSAVITVSSLLIFRSKVVEPLKSIDAKIPYIYLFMEMFMKAGVSPENAIKQISELLEDPVLHQLYRYIAVGVSYEEALRKVFGKFRGEGRTHIENLVRSGIFGLAGVQYIKETVLRLLSEREKQIEKVVKQVGVLVEVYTVLGIFTPLVAIITVVSLSALGVTLFNPAITMLLLIAMSVAVMALVASLGASAVKKVRV